MDLTEYMFSEEEIAWGNYESGIQDMQEHNKGMLGYMLEHNENVKTTYLSGGIKCLENYY